MCGACLSASKDPFQMQCSNVKKHQKHGTAQLLPQLEMVLAQLAHSSFFSRKHRLS